MTTTLSRAAVEQAPAPPQQRSGAVTTRAVDTAVAVPTSPTAAPPHTVRLALRGELSQDDRTWLAPQLDALVASGAARLEIDLSAVTHLDAAVARLLLRTHWRLGDASRRMLLLHPARSVRRTLRWYGAGYLVVP